MYAMAKMGNAIFSVLRGNVKISPYATKELIK